MLRILGHILLIAALTGCSAVAIKDAGTIETNAKLTQDVVLPVRASVAFYVDKLRPETAGVNFYGSLEDATMLVAKDMFSSVEKMSAQSEFQYLLRLRSVSKWDNLWGKWTSEVRMTVLDRGGEQLFESTTTKDYLGALGDFVAAQNSLIAAVKELLVEFLNIHGTQIADSSGSEKNKGTYPSLKELLGDVPAAESGTGFFVNQDGVVATAAHVVEGCFHIDVGNGGTWSDGRISAFSRVLDVALLETGHAKTTHAKIGKNAAPVLGKQVFVAGFPLSDILADTPSLSVGIVSSLGGLKGAKGHFQFSAQVQPGNSGGPVVDYQGNLVGMVSSTMNQVMMLQKTGTTTQNVNFGIESMLVRKFMDKHNAHYVLAEGRGDFDKASGDAMKYTVPVKCYK